MEAACACVYHLSSDSSALRARNPYMRCMHVGCMYARNRYTTGCMHVRTTRQPICHTLLTCKAWRDPAHMPYTHLSTSMSHSYRALVLHVFTSGQGRVSTAHNATQLKGGWVLDFAGWRALHGWRISARRSTWSRPTATAESTRSSRTRTTHDAGRSGQSPFARSRRPQAHDVECATLSARCCWRARDVKSATLS